MILNEIVSMANKDKVEIYFPKFFINNLDDYHDIESLANTISDIAHKKIKSSEIDIEKFGYEFNDNYSGVLYLNRKPTTKEIQEEIDSVAEKLKLKRI